MRGNTSLMFRQPQAAFMHPIHARMRPLQNTPQTSPRQPYTPLPDRLTRIPLTRLRLHLHRLRLASKPPSEANSNSDSIPAKRRRRPHYTPEERRARSERLRLRWADPKWRAAMLERRKKSETLQKLSDAARKLWSDPDYRARMRAARLGRPAPNKGLSPSPVTRLRMSLSRKGTGVSEATRRKMSHAKLKRPDNDDWPRLISESKRGKTKEYFQMRREFRALHRDLKLWSDSYRTKYGKLPDASTYDRFVAPMMILRIRRYLVLRDTIGEDEPDLKRDIITRK